MNTAIEALNGEEFMGRNLTVNEARPREERGGGGRGFGGGGGRGGYGGGGGRRGERQVAETSAIKVVATKVD